MTAAGRKALAVSGRKLPKWALWAGAIAPDLPLFLLSVSYYYYYTLQTGWSSRSAFRQIFSEHFYFDPVWIISHNLLHAPLLLLLGLGVCHLFKWRHCFWFLGAAMIHAMVDIFTHSDDGPLVFFPFNWHYRFASPVSYWDPQFHGHHFERFELALDLCLTLYLVLPWARNKWLKRDQSA